MPRHGTCLSGTDIRQDIEGYPRSDVHAASRNLLVRDGYPIGYPRIPHDILCFADHAARQLLGASERPRPGAPPGFRNQKGVGAPHNPPGPCQVEPVPV